MSEAGVVKKWTSSDLLAHSPVADQSVKEKAFIESVFADPLSANTGIAMHAEEQPVNESYLNNDRPPYIRVQISRKSIPDGATHILVLSKSSYGENEIDFVAAPFIDYVEDTEKVEQRELDQMDK